MSPGKIAAQAVHAALGLAKQEPKAGDPMHSVVVLEASDKKFYEMVRLRELSSSNICVVKDKGLTEVEPGTETVLAYAVE